MFLESFITGLILHQETQDSEDHQDFVEGIATSLHAAIQDSNMKAVTWQRVKDVATTDAECNALVEQISKGFPTLCNEVPESLQQFWPMRESLYTYQGVP